MKNIGYVSHDKELRLLIEQLEERLPELRFYDIGADLSIVHKADISHVIFDFDNFHSLSDSLLYKQIEKLQGMRLLIIGNELSELLFNHPKSGTVIAHLLKPVSPESLYAAVKYYLLDQEPSLNKDEVSERLLFGSRMYSCLLGYYYLNKAVEYCRDNNVDDSVRMAVIYDYIAVNYDTTKSKVEKSIRRLISRFEGGRHRTNSEWILYFYGQLQSNRVEL